MNALLTVIKVLMGLEIETVKPITVHRQILQIRLLTVKTSDCWSIYNSLILEIQRGGEVC